MATARLEFATVIHGTGYWRGWLIPLTHVRPLDLTNNDNDPGWVLSQIFI
jgi:hypothetical protein